MKIIGLLGGVGFLLILPILGSPATAQTVLTDPGAVRACLCQQEAVTTLNNRVQAERQTYETQRQSLQALDNQVQAQRAQLSANPGGDTDVLKGLLDQRDQTQRSFTNETTPAYAAAVSRYNAAVASFNEQCSGRIYAPGAEAAVRATNFSCPRP